MLREVYVLAYVIWTVFFTHLEEQQCRIQVVLLLVAAGIVQSVQILMFPKTNA